jgi:hypothetical protein
MSNSSFQKDKAQKKEPTVKEKKFEFEESKPFLKKHVSTESEQMTFKTGEFKAYMKSPESKGPEILEQ